jgi:acetyl esterase/lipase
MNTIKRAIHISYDCHERCVLDVYYDQYHASRPKGEVVVFVHGGAFMSSSKNGVKDTCESLASQGYVVFAPSYRLSYFDADSVQRLILSQLVVIVALGYGGSAKTHALLSCMVILFVLCITNHAIFTHGNSVVHPAHVRDLAKCTAWVANNSHLYGGDREKIYLMGHSAGGHLVTLLANNRRFLRECNVSDGTIRGVVCLSGVLSDARLAETIVGRSLMSSVFETTKGKNYDAFPVYHCNQLSPPHLFINAENDISLRSHTWDMYHALKQQGIRATVKVVKGDHFSVRKFIGDNAETLLSIKKFTSDESSRY